MNIMEDMENQDRIELDKKLKAIYSTLEVSYDGNYHIVYVHNLNLIDDKKLLDLQGKYNFSISQGIFAK